jgi:hypothetical protein
MLTMIRKRKLALAYLATFEPIQIILALDKRIVLSFIEIYKVKNSNFIKNTKSGRSLNMILAIKTYGSMALRGT